MSRPPWSFRALVAASGGALESFAEDLDARGLTNGDLVIPSFEAWAALGAPAAPEGERDDADEILERWSLLQRALSDAGGGPIELTVRSEGFVGAAAARLRLFVNGIEWQPGTEFSGWPLRTLMPPVLAHAMALATEPAPTKPAQYARWGRLREHLVRSVDALASRLSLQLDGHLHGLVVRTPKRFSLGWVSTGTTGRTVSLQLSEVNPAGAWRALDLGGLDPATGVVSATSREHILLPDPVAQTARLVRERQGQLRSRRVGELEDPALLFPEGAAADEWFDLSEYSERVVGFERVVRSAGSFRFADLSAGGYYESESDLAFLRLDFQRSSDDASFAVRLETAVDAEEFLATVDAAMIPDATAAVIAWRGFAFEATHDLRDTVHRAIVVHLEAQQPQVIEPQLSEPGRMAAVIEERGESPDFDVDGPRCDESCVPFDLLGELLRADVTLKPHQRRGIAWLWNHAEAGEPGVLLADDMGLGKTLQVACFLAMRRARWLATSNAARLGPVLVVAPTILLDNWVAEIGRFFRPGVFGGTVLLHGPAIQVLRGPNGLDTERLGAASLVLTNYDTLARYQVSLLRVAFSVVVFDEAQAVKNETTLRSRAAQGLKRDFAIAMTGTPVENRLRDLWAIFEALQPRTQQRAFGTRPQFESEYEADRVLGVQRLRERLAFPTAGSIVLRREKARALRDLPPKVTHQRPIAMSANQLSLERSIVNELRQRGPFGILDKLRKLYQHPELVAPRRETWLSANDVVEQSPKVRETLNILEEVRQRGEKAIVFTQWVGMQVLLQRVIGEAFGLPHVGLINGDPTLRARAHQTIELFSSGAGFDVLILSPLAAGVGLTITAANHVIHYGRWWNPAKEDQATDRAHRIGQTREVQVYFPLLHHPGAPEKGFDIRFHALVERKRAVARDFLAPPQDEDLERELLGVVEHEGQKEGREWTSF